MKLNELFDIATEDKPGLGSKIKSGAKKLKKRFDKWADDADARDREWMDDFKAPFRKKDLEEDADSEFEVGDNVKFYWGKGQWQEGEIVALHDDGGMDVDTGRNVYSLGAEHEVLSLDLYEGYYELPPIDRDRYNDRSYDGLEGPIQTRSGKVVYYDPHEGMYYDIDTDTYLSFDEFNALDRSMVDEDGCDLEERVGEIPGGTKVSFGWPSTAEKVFTGTVISYGSNQGETGYWVNSSETGEDVFVGDSDFIEPLVMEDDDIVCEGAKMVWARTGNKVVRKYRCTDGPRKGRVVASPSQCNAPIDLKKRQKMKMTRAAKGKKMARVAKKTKRANPASRRVQQMNKRGK